MSLPVQWWYGEVSFLLPALRTTGLRYASCVGLRLMIGSDCTALVSSVRSLPLVLNCTATGLASTVTVSARPATRIVTSTVTSPRA